MPDKDEERGESTAAGFIDELKRLDRQKKRKQAEKEEKSIWFGLGFMGLIGWSVAVPTVLGAIGGAFIDARTDSRYSWTLMLMFLGLIIGGLNAWFWVTRERKKMVQERESVKEEDEEEDNNGS